MAKLGDSTKVNVIARKFLGIGSVILHHSTVAVCRQRVRSRNEDSSQLMIGLLTETSVIGSVLVAPSPWQSEADGCSGFSNGTLCEVKLPEQSEESQ